MPLATGSETGSPAARQNRIANWLTTIVAVVSLPFVAALGLWEYMDATATPLHPDARAVPSAAHSTPLPRWAEAVEQARPLVRAGLTEQNLPGVSVAVGVGGDIVWAEGFGWADLENQVKVTPETRFRIGTASTALTSAAVGLLLEKGRLKLDDEIQAHVPEFPRKEWPVTLRHLMGHLAGVRTDGGDEGPLFSKHCQRPVEALPHFAESPLLFEPGTRYRYSSYGWILMSAAVEAAANEPFLKFMREHVFEPAGMTRTTADSGTADSEAAPPQGQAISYFPRFAGDPTYGPDVMRPLDYSCYSGSSVFVSTPSDLVRFAIAIRSGKILKPETVRSFQTSQQLPSGLETGYGLGWDLETATLSGGQTSLVGHDGDLLGGLAVSFMTFPEYGIAVSVASNTSYADTYSIAVRIAEAFANSPPRTSEVP